jgi:hypothetical protein
VSYTINDFCFWQIIDDKRDYPCERAGLKLNAGQNRWLDLIRLSSKYIGSQTESISTKD